MEECTFIESLLNLFQDIDAISMFSQLILEDMSNKDIFQHRSDNSRLAIMLDQFCDIVLQSFHKFMEHKHIKPKQEESMCSNIINYPEDIPCAIDKICKYLPSLIRQLQMRSGLSKNKKEEKIYFSRLVRFLKYVNEEIVFFSAHDNMYLLHTCQHQ